MSAAHWPAAAAAAACCCTRPPARRPPHLAGHHAVLRLQRVEPGGVQQGVDVLETPHQLAQRVNHEAGAAGAGFHCVLHLDAAVQVGGDLQQKSGDKKSAAAAAEVGPPQQTGPDNTRMSCGTFLKSNKPQRSMQRAPAERARPRAPCLASCGPARSPLACAAPVRLAGPAARACPPWGGRRCRRRAAAAPGRVR